ncbi:MAG TPA: SRPBCC family protein, partial [Candidatus Synoicihabitans sp.]|nr:SRPBCC family protein [Candidatus Synoicihabitans sp.]
MTTTINDAAGEFTAPGEIVFIRRLPGPIERVWTYLTEPEKRRRWLADGPMELRVGGRVELQFHHHELAEADDAPPPKYESMACSQPTLVGRVLRCEPPHALSYTWEDGDKGGSEVTFELSPVGDDVQ